MASQAEPTGGPCPGTFCAGNELELDDLRLVDSDAASVTFEAVVNNHALSLLGNPNVCRADNGSQGIGGILTFQIRGIPESRLVVEECFPSNPFSPPATRMVEFKAQKPEAGEEPQVYTAGAVLCTSDTGDCSEERTEAFTVEPDGSVGGGDNGDGSDDEEGPLDDLFNLIGRLEGLVVLLLIAVIVKSFADLFGDE